MRPPEPTACYVCEARRICDLDHTPSLQAFLEQLRSEHTARISLSRIVPSLTSSKSFRRVPFNFLVQAQWLVVKVAKDKPADESHCRIKNDDPSAWRKNPREFLQSRPGISKVVPDVEQDQVANFLRTERKIVGILDAIQPRIRENICRYRLWDVLFDITHTRSEFDDQTGNGWIQSAGDLTIELCIYLAKERLFLPEFAVLADFDIVLFNAREHCSNDLVWFAQVFDVELNYHLTNGASILPKVWNAHFCAILERPGRSSAIQDNRMNLSTDGRNPLLSAYSLVRRSGFLQTSVGRSLFKSAYFLYKRYIEDDLEGLIRALPRLVSGGDILDIGANIGYTAAVLARAAQPDYKVYAFEPEPFNFGILQQAALQPEYAGKVIPMQMAVGAEDGNIDLWINDRHHADHRVATDQFHLAHQRKKEISVSMVSIDSFLDRRPGPVSFAKIDVQGYELAVVRGMQNTLRQNPGITILLEYMPSAMRELGFEASHLIDFLVERDFKIYQVHPRGKISPGMPAVANDASYVNLLFSRHPIP